MIAMKEISIVGEGLTLVKIETDEEYASTTFLEPAITYETTEVYLPSPQSLILRDMRDYNNCTLMIATLFAEDYMKVISVSDDELERIKKIVAILNTKEIAEKPEVKPL